MVSRHGESARYFSWTGHIMTPDVLLISTRSWEKLSDDHKKLLQDAANESSDLMVSLWDEAEKKNIEKARKEGITFIEPDRESFVRSVEPLYAQLKKDNPAMYELVQKIRH